MLAVQLLGDRGDLLLGELPDGPPQELPLLAQIEIHAAGAASTSPRSPASRCASSAISRTP